MPDHRDQKRPHLRRTGRWAALAASAALAWPWGSEVQIWLLLPAFSPHVALGSALALRTAGALTLLALPILALTLVMPRWFCRHACPTGFLQELIERLRPAAVRPWDRVPPLGQWLLLLTLGGACLGFPLFLWLDPLALFNACLAGWGRPLSPAWWPAALGLPLLLVLAAGAPRLWCRRLCPLGACQDILARPAQLIRERLLPRPAAQPRRAPPHGLPLARRSFLGLCAGAATVAAGRAVGKGSPLPPRPPGALNESRFSGVCIRCGRCGAACPARIIHPDLGGHGAASWLTPVLSFDRDYCREQCHRCNQVCPSGAIARLSLPEKQRRIIGLASVDVALCLLAGGRECTACIRCCPYSAVSLHTGDDGFTTSPQVDPARCNGCGACQAACPTRPARAIHIQPGRRP